MHEMMSVRRYPLSRCIMLSVKTDQRVQEVWLHFGTSRTKVKSPMYKYIVRKTRLPTMRHCWNPRIL